MRENQLAERGQAGKESMTPATEEPWGAAERNSGGVRDGLGSGSPGFPPRYLSHPRQHAHHTLVLHWAVGLGRRSERSGRKANSTKAGWPREARLI